MVADVALIVTAVGVFAAVFGLRQSNRERLRQFEAMYVQRYWSILDDLSLQVMEGTAGYSPSEADLKAIRAYMFLCEDELEMRGRGYIADTTYKMWAVAIADQFKQPIFGAVWKQVQHEEAFPYANLRALCSQPESYDPLAEVGYVRRWARGLTGVGMF